MVQSASWTISPTATNPIPKERLEVFCEGMIAVLDDYVSLTTVKDGKKKEESGAQDKGWKSEMTAFAEAIRERGRTAHSLRTAHRRDQVHVCGGGVDSNTSIH